MALLIGQDDNSTTAVLSTLYGGVIGFLDAALESSAALDHRGRDNSLNGALDIFVYLQERVHEDLPRESASILLNLAGDDVLRQYSNAGRFFPFR
jgi:hypothetical protein